MVDKEEKEKKAEMSAEELAEEQRRIDEAVAKIQAAIKERDVYHAKEMVSAERVSKEVARMRGAHAKALLRYNGGTYWGSGKMDSHPSVILNCQDLERVLLFREQLIKERDALLEAGQGLAAALEELGAGDDNADAALINWERAKVRAWACER